MKIRFYNAKVLTMDGNADIINGEVRTHGDTITYVGASAENPAEKFDREIDLQGNLIMPSFKNAHTHSAMTFLRSYADDMPLNDWLFKQVFPMEDKLTGEDIYWLSRLAFLEYVSSGITACFDMYFEPEYMAKSATDANFRVVMCGAVNNFGTTVQKMSDYFEKYRNHSPLVSYRLGFHSEYTNSVDNMKAIAELSHTYKAPVYTHNAETAFETDGCKERHNGKTPTVLFEELGMFEYGGGGFHCVHMTDADLEIFKARKLWAVTNPASNCKLASGIAPICKMLDMGINVAIGTDGPASNNALDMFREMYLTAVLQKILLNDASAMPADKVLEFACKNGALAMGLNNCDVLAVGKTADLIVIDLEQPNMRPLNNIVKNIVYAGSKTNVKMTVIGGEIVYENGVFAAKDVAEVFDMSDKIIKRISNEVLT